jgi:hypothetical protein
MSEYRCRNSFVCFRSWTPLPQSFRRCYCGMSLSLTQTLVFLLGKRKYFSSSEVRMPGGQDFLTSRLTKQLAPLILLAAGEESPAQRRSNESSYASNEIKSYAP